MINPSELYPDATETAEGYPYGRATRFVLDAAWLNDLWGFHEAVLRASGQEPTGYADAAGASQLLAGAQRIMEQQLAAYGRRYELRACAPCASAARSLPIEKPPFAISLAGFALSADGRHLYGVFSFGRARQLDLFPVPGLLGEANSRPGEPYMHIFIEAGETRSITLSADGQQVFLCLASGAILRGRLLQRGVLGTRVEMRDAGTMEEGRIDVAFSPDGLHALEVYADRVVSLELPEPWRIDLRGDSRVRSASELAVTRFHSGDWAPDGRTFVAVADSAEGRGLVQFWMDTPWQVNAARLDYRLPRDAAGAVCVRWRADGRSLLYCDADRVFQLDAVGIHK